MSVISRRSVAFVAALVLSVTGVTSFAYAETTEPAQDASPIVESSQEIQEQPTNEELQPVSEESQPETEEIEQETAVSVPENGTNVPAEALDTRNAPSAAAYGTPVNVPEDFVVLPYTGGALNGVPWSPAYTITGVNTAITPGSYKAYVTPNPGYYWRDRSWDPTGTETVYWYIWDDPFAVNLTWIVRSDDIAVGAAVEPSNYVSIKYEYRWTSYNVQTGQWKTIADWGPGNWAAWSDDKGTYWLNLEVRSSATKQVLGQKTIAFAYSPGYGRITGTYAGTQPNGTVLLGSSTNNPTGRLVTKIYDVQQGTWVAQYHGPWNTWNPRPGVYWTHYELYNAAGKLQDVKTYAFQMN